jgi:hypothetical protein
MKNKVSELPRLGDAEIEERYQLQMNVVAQSLDQWFNGKAKGQDRMTGFVLMVFPFDRDSADGHCNYISNGADRKDVVCLMKEMIARFEGQPQMNGRA